MYRSEVLATKDLLVSRQMIHRAHLVAGLQYYVDYLEASILAEVNICLKILQSTAYHAPQHAAGTSHLKEAPTFLVDLCWRRTR